MQKWPTLFQKKSAFQHKKPSRSQLYRSNGICLVYSCTEASGYVWFTVVQKQRDMSGSQLYRSNGICLVSRTEICCIDKRQIQNVTPGSIFIWRSDQYLHCVKILFLRFGLKMLFGLLSLWIPCSPPCRYVVYFAGSVHFPMGTTNKHVSSNLDFLVQTETFVNAWFCIIHELQLQFSCINLSYYLLL